MKYIVFELDGKEEIIVFPRTVDHDAMLEGVRMIRFGGRQNWERKLFDVEPVAAGFVGNGVCHGSSETLKIGSRGALDTALFEKAWGSA